MDRDIAAGERLLVSHVVAQMQHSVSWKRTNVREEIVRPPPVHVRHVTMADPVRRTVDLWTDVAQMCAHMQQQLLAGKNIAVFCATKKFAEKLCAALKPYFGDATVITGDTDARRKARVWHRTGQVVCQERAREFGSTRRRPQSVCRSMRSAFTRST
jgi:excinuclease UvrABC helicase subunit UvrB